MSSNISLRSAPVTPLPIGSGGSNTTSQHMNNMNTQLTMMSVQSSADTKYDPPVPKYATPQVQLEGFCEKESIVESIFVAGLLFIVYGLISK